jgi:hypothetical protein
VCLSSTEDYIVVKKKIADAIQVDVRDLCPLLYKIEKDRDQSTFRDLNSQIHWDYIVSWGRNYRTAQTRKTTGTPDKWAVKIKEVTEGKTNSKVRELLMLPKSYNSNISIG